MTNYKKYEKQYDWKKMPNRKWPDNEIKKAPKWCSVDLRDGNQSLSNPMSLQEKTEFFEYLVEIGFKEIEVGYPAASDTEFNFVRYLIENNKIPEDVTIQVLTQSKEKIINRTFEAIKGAKKVILHLNNSISKAQREMVYQKSKKEIKEMAVDGAKIIREKAKKNPEIEWTFYYGLESFSQAELDYSVEIIDEIIEVWKDATKNKIIIDLPTTVECSTPNVFADQVEYICKNIRNRKNITICVHTHNDRGTAVAAAELALLAGAERIEGTIFGNGERAGNADIVNLALNMYCVGIDPKLDFSNINRTKKMYNNYIKIPISPRHPYVGENIFISFSGQHQNAISKSIKYAYENKIDKWNIPYLPIDPKDIGREFESIIRINSQSGKGGISYLLDKEYGITIPKEKMEEIGAYIKLIADKKGRELSISEIYEEIKKIEDIEL